MSSRIERNYTDADMRVWELIQSARSTREQAWDAVQIVSAWIGGLAVAGILWIGILRAIEAIELEGTAMFFLRVFLGILSASVLAYSLRYFRRYGRSKSWAKGWNHDDAL